MLEPVLKKNDKLAYILIGVFSAVVLVVVTFLSKFTLEVELPFDKHIFALINAVINSAVAVLLIAGLIAIKQKITPYISLLCSPRWCFLCCF
jgi:putative membrane protein